MQAINHSMDILAEIMGDAIKESNAMDHHLTVTQHFEESKEDDVELHAQLVEVVMTGEITEEIDS